MLYWRSIIGGMGEKKLFDVYQKLFEEYEVLKKTISYDYMTWHKKELENIGKIGLNSKSFIDVKEDYSKW